MDNRKVTLEAAGQTQVRGNIKRVILRRASGPVLIETDEAEAVEAIQGDNILFEKACGVMSITDVSGFPNELVLLLVSSSEGDVSGAAGTVEVANTAEMGRSIQTGANTCDIRRYTVGTSGVKALEDITRRSALLSSSGPIEVATSQAGTRMVIDGVLDYPASGELWLWTNEGTVTVELMEFTD